MTPSHRAGSAEATAITKTKTGSAAVEKSPVLLTNRVETETELRLLEGSIPEDLHGSFYVVYPAGSINSGGLPYPQETSDGKYNSEYGSPIMSGDGMSLKISFNGSNLPVLKSKLMKTPCYYADESLPYGSSYSPAGFSNWGISRISTVLGFRNLLNTSLIPVKFGKSNPFFLGCYDVGRHFLVDAQSLKLISPLGKNSDWISGAPTTQIWAFPLVQTTAHPSFDAHTQELFSVNYASIVGSGGFKITEKSVFHLKHNRETFKEKLTQLCHHLKEELDIHKIKSELHHFFFNLDEIIAGHPAKETPPPPANGTLVYLLRWCGGKEIEKWQLHDQHGNPLIIEECMHQTSITKDYIILTDTSFKFTLDLLINNPFPDSPTIDAFIRKKLTAAMEPSTRCYIVKRADLVSATDGKVTAWELDAPIPLETIHYSTDYENPGNRITLYGIHNAAACVAEWIRTFDVSKITGQAIDKDLISLFALGSMDLNRLGKWVIDMNTYSIDQQASKAYYSTGKPEQEDVGPNTWTLGLYTYRDMISPQTMVSKIKYLWFCSNGLDSRSLTEFIFELYKDYPNRLIPVEKMLEYTKLSIPFTLVRLSTEDMQAEEYFQFPKNTFIRSLVFVPRKGIGAIDPQLDGYIFCTVQVGSPAEDPIQYRGEYWVFDANDLKKGPLCKLTCDDIIFCFTLHAAFLEEPLGYNHDYMIDVESDYNETISGLIDCKTVQEFFNKNVYPAWNNRE